MALRALNRACAAGAPLVVVSAAMSIAALVAALAATPAALAQAVSVFGAGDAERCADAAAVGDASVVAIQACDAALAGQPLRRKDRAATHINRGILRAARGDFTAAIADYDRGVALIPDLGEAYVNRGNVRFRLKRYADAVADYDAALALGLGPRHVAHLNRGAANLMLKRFEDARADYQAALAARPGWPEAARRLDELDAALNADG